MQSPVAILVAAAIAFIALSSKGAEAGMLSQCLQDNGSDMATFLKLLSTGEADHNVKCAVKCAMVNLNAVDDQGNCLTDGLRFFHSMPLYDKIDTCCEGASSIPDPCEKVYSYQMCMRKADLEQLKSNWQTLTSM